MKVVALNSSPRTDKGGTTLILTPFLQGVKEAGADIELIYVHSLTVNPCLGCFNCWLKTPGQCIQKDDMNTILKKLAAADVIVLATPVYVDGMNGPLKILVDRMIPLVEPFFEIRQEHCRHPLRESVNPGRVVLVAVCGFTELDNFDPLLIHVKAICKNIGAEFAGALLRPYAASLPSIARRGIKVNDIYEAAHLAGTQLIKEGKINPLTLETVSREVVSRKEYIQAVNSSFQQALNALEK